jgi:hypothetical protein
MEIIVVRPQMSGARLERDYARRSTAGVTKKFLLGKLIGELQGRLALL